MKNLFKKNKKLEVIKVDENGNVIDPSPKKEKGKGLGKKLLIGALGLVGGVIAFVGVGVAMAYADEKSSENTGFEDGTIETVSDVDSSNEETETESTGTSEE